MEVGNLLHAPGDVGGSGGTAGVTVGLLLVVVITQDEAQEESRHHDVSDAQHREVAARGAGTQGHVSGVRLLPPHSSCSRSVRFLRSQRIYLMADGNCYWFNSTGC